MKRNIRIPILILLVLVIFVLLQVFNAFHFYYIEQFQLFQTTNLYFLKCFSHPGGGLEYVSHFVVQFFIVPYIGAFISTVVLILIYLGAERLFYKNLRKNPFIASATILIACLFMCFDFNIFYRAVLSVLLCVWALNVVFLAKNDVVRSIISILFLPILFWFAGSITVLFAISFCLIELKKNKGRMKSLGVIVLTMAIIIAWLSYRLFFTGNLSVSFLPDMYYQSQLKPSFLIYIPWFLIVFWLSIAFVLPKTSVSDKKKYLFYGMQGGLVALLFAVGLIKYSDRTSYMVKKLDYYARNQQWDKIISISEKTDIHNYLHLNYLNLALAEKGELLDKMFLFNQKGTASLEVSSNKKNLIAGVLSDIYFCVGNIASSQQYAFEGCEINDDGGCGRLMKRLVQTNLILGEYAVAEKYIKILEHTFFYHKWATQHRQFLNNNNLCKEDSVLGSKIIFLPEKGSRYYTTGGPETFDLLVRINTSNKAARDYFFASLLLDKNMKLFLENLSRYIQGGAMEMPMPESVQQAFLMCYERDVDAWEKVGISENTIRLFKSYRATAIKNKESNGVKDILHKHYASTYWYYYMFISVKK